MAFRYLPVRPLAAGDILGGPVINALYRHLTDAAQAIGRQHSPGTAGDGGGGAHNSRLISRGIGTVYWTGSEYIFGDTHGCVSGVTRISEGHARITLDPPMTGRYAPWAGINSEGPSLGRSCSAVVVDASTVDVFISGVSKVEGEFLSAEIVPVDAGFFIDIMGEPSVPPTAAGTQYLHALEERVRSYLDEVEAGHLDAIGQALQAMYDVLTQNHTSSGVHDDPLIARGWAVVGYDVAADDYTIIAKDGIIESVTRLSDGGFHLNLTSPLSGLEWFVGHSPLAGVISKTPPAAGSWGGHITTAHVESQTQARIGVGRVADGDEGEGGYIESHGGAYVEVKGVMA